MPISNVNMVSSETIRRNRLIGGLSLESGHHGNAYTVYQASGDFIFHYKYQRTEQMVNHYPSYFQFDKKKSMVPCTYAKYKTHSHFRRIHDWVSWMLLYKISNICVPEKKIEDVNELGPSSRLTLAQNLL